MKNRPILIRFAARTADRDQNVPQVSSPSPSTLGEGWGEGGPYRTLKILTPRPLAGSRPIRSLLPEYQERGKFFRPSNLSRTSRMALFPRWRSFATTLLVALLATSLLASCEKREEKLHLFIVSEYVPREVIDGFTQETGIPTDTEVYDTNEAMLSKLISNPSQYDVVQPSEYTVEHLIREKLLAPLDFSQIPNVKNLETNMRDLPYDPGQKYSVPYMTGTVGIIVNTDVIKEPIHGFTDVFQEKYKQRIVVADDNREIVSWAFSAAGIPINEVTPENLARVKPLLKKWIPLIKVFAAATPMQPLLGGEVDLGVIYSGDAAALLARDKRFIFVLPKEGAHRYVDNLCIPAGARHKEAAQKFINYVLKPEVSKIISDRFPYTNPNEAARKLLSPAQLANPASYPPGGIDHLEVFHDIGRAASDVSALMTELRNGG